MPTFALTFARMSDRSRREEGAQAHEQEQVHKEGRHQSVLLKEVVHYLEPKDGEVVVDATYGAGGHSQALKRAAKIQLVALDADPSAVAAGEGVIEANFGDLAHVLKKEGVTSIDKALFDLGWRSEQLASGRGFTFAADEQLNMSYGPTPASGFTAAEILNTWSEEAIANALYGYGEERYARRIAKAVVARRRVAAINTTLELVELVRDSVPPAYRHGRLNPATRTFQALRVAVNDELGVIERGLTAAWEHLSCGGRIAVITFHSIEDRKVKQLFANFAKENGQLVTKKPIVPTRAEITTNPRARSAKLRVIEKVC